MEPYTLMHGDCLDLMATLPDASIDMIMCDLPYGTTACAWDSVIPFAQLWEHYWRIAKNNAAIVLTASQPFTTSLAASQIKRLAYSMVWEKEQASNFMLMKKQIGKIHEDILIFYRAQPTYNPQMTTGHAPAPKGAANKVRVTNGANAGGLHARTGATDRYPTSIVKFNRDKTKGNKTQAHPTQKPVALMEYLIRTYTNEGDTVLDNCMGSGTTGVACINTGRNFVGMERDDKYFAIAKNRIEDAYLEREGLL